MQQPGPPFVGIQKTYGRRGPLQQYRLAASISFRCIRCGEVKTADWQRVHPWPADLKAFEREILPGLAAVPARVLAEATGLSVGYCRRVKAGLASPHPMWWDAMRAMAR